MTIPMIMALIFAFVVGVAFSQMCLVPVPELDYDPELEEIPDGESEGAGPGETN